MNTGSGPRAQPWLEEGGCLALRSHPPSPSSCTPLPAEPDLGTYLVSPTPLTSGLPEPLPTPRLIQAPGPDLSLWARHLPA